MTQKTLMVFLSIVLFSFAIQAAEPDFMKVKSMTAKLASDIAINALKTYNKKGYQISVVVVDRNGTPQAVLRNVYASRFTLQIAREKANASILSRMRSSQFRRNRKDIRPELNHVKGILMEKGGPQSRFPDPSSAL